MSNLGAIYTPPNIANLLVDWAIQSPNETVLDLGTGEGVFVFASHSRLVSLGAKPEIAASQIYGAEIDRKAFERFKKSSSISFPNIICNDFFALTFPEVDVVVGNPPYVRRRRISPQDTENIRNTILPFLRGIQYGDLSYLTDLYVYFLLQASKYLKRGGRLAVVVADSWLSTRYGVALRNFLIKNFNIEHIVSFDRPIFPDVQVKPVLLLATKIDETNERKKDVTFIRVRNGLSVPRLQRFLGHDTTPAHHDIQTVLVPYTNLGDSIWSKYFRLSYISEILENHERFVPLQKLAYARIGVQTLAKRFFVLTPEQVAKKQIESEYINPFAYSISQFDEPVINEETEPNLYVFTCAKSRGDLEGTQALVHILQGEKQTVTVRGRNKIVVGYHNKERIKRSNRQYWYDLQTSIEKRGRAPILIPRLIYGKYFAIWNQAQYVPGGAMIEIFPRDSANTRMVRMLLAIFNSTLFEVMIRGNAQLYGGGTYTVNISQLKQILIPDVTSLNMTQQNALLNAYTDFLNTKERAKIDEIIGNCFNLDMKPFYDKVDDLKSLSLLSKK